MKGDLALIQAQLKLSKYDAQTKVADFALSDFTRIDLKSFEKMEPLTSDSFLGFSASNNNVRYLFANLERSSAKESNFETGLFDID
jgi:hypothetical protein